MVLLSDYHERPKKSKIQKKHTKHSYDSKGIRTYNHLICNPVAVDWLTPFPSEITTARYSQAYLIASVIRLVCSNRNFASSCLTSSILHKKIGPPKSVCVIKLITVFARRCDFLTALPNATPPLYCKVVLTYILSYNKMQVFWRESGRFWKILYKQKSSSKALWG